MHNATAARARDDRNRYGHHALIVHLEAPVMDNAGRSPPISHLLAFNVKTGIMLAAAVVVGTSAGWGSSGAQILDHYTGQQFCRPLQRPTIYRSHHNSSLRRVNSIATSYADCAAETFPSLANSRSGAAFASIACSVRSSWEGIAPARAQAEVGPPLALQGGHALQLLYTEPLPRSCSTSTPCQFNDCNYEAVPGFYCCRLWPIAEAKWSVPRRRTHTVMAISNDIRAFGKVHGQAPAMSVKEFHRHWPIGTTPTDNGKAATTIPRVCTNAKTDDSTATATFKNESQPKKLPSPHVRQDVIKHPSRALVQTLPVQGASSTTAPPSASITTTSDDNTVDELVSSKIESDGRRQLQGTADCPLDFPHMVTNSQCNWQDALCFTTAYCASRSR